MTEPDDVPAEAPAPDPEQPEAAAEPRAPEARKRPLPPEDPSGLPRLGIAFAVLFVVNVAYGLIAGTLSVSLLGLVMGPLVGALIIYMVIGSITDLRRGPRQRGVIVLFVLVAIVGYLASGAFARSMIFPGNRRPLPDPGTELEGGKVVAYTTADGITLKGFLIRGKGPEPRPAVVHFHGNADCAAYNVGFANQLASRNLDVLIAEYRGYGGCDGSPSEPGLREDGLAALALLERELGTQPTDVVLSGQSLGTAVACLLAGEGHGRAVFLLSPFSSVRSMGERMVTPALTAVALRDPFESQQSLLKVEHPVVILHGTQDPVIPFEEGKSLAGALGDRVTFIPLEGLGHNDVHARAGKLIADELAKLAHAK